MTLETTAPVVGRQSSQHARDVDRWGVVPSKLRPPRRRNDLIERPALIEALATDDRPIVAVIAPAGFGKSTLVRSWTLADPRPVAWLTADRGDDDPVVFVRHVVRALHHLAPLDTVEALLATRAPNIAGRVMPALAAALADGRPPFLLVIDDVHLIGSPATAELVGAIVDNLPPGSRVALVGRAATALRLGRRALAGEVQEVRDDDLRLNDDEVTTLLRANLPTLGTDDAAAIAGWVEGWPAGVRMAVLGLSAAPAERRTDVIARAAGDRRLAELVDEEFLQHLDASAHDFLMRTSILERFDVELCDAVLERTDSGRRLQSLLTSDNPFVIGFDEVRWWRYHHLFGDMLLAELRRRDPGAEATLRRRAALALSERGLAGQAVTQALSTGDPAFASRILYEHVPATFTLGGISSIERWLADLPESAARREPLAALARGWLAFGRLAGDEAKRWIEVAQRSVGDPDHEASARIAGLPPLDLGLEIAALAMAVGSRGLAASVELARRLREAGPDRSRWWSLAVLHEATGELALGNDALGALLDAEAATRGADAAHVVALTNLTILHFLEHRDDEALATFEQAETEFEAAGLADFPPLATFQAVRAVVAARRGRSDDVAAAIHATEALLAHEREFNLRGVLQTRLCLADAALRIGDRTCALHQLARCDELLAHEPDAARLRAWAVRLRSQLRGADELVVPLTAAERRVLGELASHRTLAEIAERLYVSRNTVKTQTIAIYRKLGVSGRSAAVDRARELRLVED
ncbi:MAG: LuxR C-terminal-related transcriptional regulator [Ilumatobacteraceae bacterium]|nr:LuxR C-terminal-related transcriptional regulator [Ilumatobacteraceae bacterium]